MSFLSRLLAATAEMPSCQILAICKVSAVVHAHVLPSTLWGGLQWVECFRTLNWLRARPPQIIFKSPALGVGGNWGGEQFAQVTFACNSPQACACPK